MITASRRLLLVILAMQSGCAPGPAAAEPASPVAVTPAPRAVSTPEPARPPAPPPEPPASEPPPTPAPAVDLASVTAIRFKIVAIPNRKDWVPCGGMHSVGALEVEVLDAGEPPPHMILLVSCPADMRKVKLAVGETLATTLHRRKQPWPAVRKLPTDLPRRQVASFAASPDPPPR